MRASRIATGYQRVLDRHCTGSGCSAEQMLAALVALVLLFKLLPSELAPAQDRGSFSSW